MTVDLTGHGQLAARVIPGRPPPKRTYVVPPVSRTSFIRQAVLTAEEMAGQGVGTVGPEKL
jgi:hypothetical protein